MTITKERGSYHVMVGLGSPTKRHSKNTLVPSSDWRITGRSVKVGLTLSCVFPSLDEFK